MPPLVKRLVRRLDATLAFVSKITSIVGGAALLFILAVTVGDVWLRNTTNRPLRGAVGYSEVALVLVVYLGLAYAERTGAHIRVTFVVDRLPPRLALTVSRISQVPILALVAWMSYLASREAYRSWQINEVRVGIERAPVWPARLIIAFGLTLLFLELLSDAIRREGRAVATPMEGEVL